MRRAFVYPRARWLTGVALQDLVLVAMLVIVLAWRPPGLLAIVLGIAIPVVLAWGFATLHFPSRVTIDDDGIAFHAYGRAHRFAWREVRAVREQWKDGFFVVPGLRMTEHGVGDQKRVVTPRQARDDGASVLVVGRPISRADEPLAAARMLEATL